MVGAVKGDEFPSPPGDGKAILSSPPTGLFVVVVLPSSTLPVIEAASGDVVVGVIATV